MAPSPKAASARGFGRNGPRRSKYDEVASSDRSSKSHRIGAEEKGKWIQAARSAANSKAEQKAQAIANTSQKMETKLSAPPGLSLPSRHSEVATSQSAEEVVTDPIDFIEVLRGRSLPSALQSDGQLQSSFDTAVLSSVESFYRDRIAPTLGELQQRLRDIGWGSNEVQAVLAWCARNSDKYDLTPPGHNTSTLVLLRERPEWFKNWIDDDDAEDTYSEAEWSDLRKILKHLGQESPDFSFLGGLSQLAATVKKSNLGPHVGLLSLGEIRKMLRLAMSPQRHYFSYDALHGGRLARPRKSGTSQKNSSRESVGQRSPNACDVSHIATPTRSVPKAPKETPEKSSAQHSKHVVPCETLSMLGPENVEARVLHMLRNRSLPEGLGAGCHLRALRSCVDSLYRDRIEPSLGEVQQRLLKKGWNFQEVQATLPLCARQVKEYDIKLPIDGCQVLILLRTPPSWFDGWISETQSENRSFISPDVWDVLAAFLKAECPSLGGSINGAAQELRQLSLPVPLQQLSLGELREVVKAAIEEHGLLHYWKGNLVPTEITLQAHVADHVTPESSNRVYSCI
mmetsp:Transcript_90600/g.143110  ORF Transcript_90600/g.143110 Transcript_90600/m.143110 type:complete len:570 (+) Transcript_90600:75-1784(+)